MSESKIGYGNPPKHSQFKKGQSGNPKGRKPRSRNTSTLLSEELEKVIEVREAARIRKITKREALIASLVNDAIAGKRQGRPLLLKIIELENPPEAFEASDGDQALLDNYLTLQERDNRGSPEEN